MKCIVHADHLSTAITRVSGAFRDKSINYYALRTFEDSSLEIQAVDQTIALFSSVPSQNFEPGTLFIPAKIFSTLVKELPPFPIELSSNGTYLQVSQGSSLSIQLPLIEKGSWQTPASQFTGETLTLTTAQLRQLIEQVIFCLAEYPSRDYGDIGCMHVLNETQLCLVATDGYRMAKSETELREPTKALTKGVCISKHGLFELARLCMVSEGDICLQFSADYNAILATMEQNRLYLLLSSTQYPDYQTILPKEWGSRFQIDKRRLYESLRRILLTADINKTVMIQTESPEVCLFSKNHQNFEAKEFIEAIEIQGTSEQISINGKFLADILTISSAEVIEFLILNQEQPVIIIPQDRNQDVKSLYVLVPIKAEA